MTARLLLRALWRRRLVALVLLVLTIAATNFYLSGLPRTYTATASVAIVPGEAEEGFDGLSGPLLGTLVDQAVGNDVLGAAVAPVPGAPSIGELRGATTVQAVTDAFTLRISVELEDPAMAAELANRIAGSLPRFNLVPGRVAYRAVDVALPPSSPTSPQVSLVLAVGTLLGIALAVAGALLLDDALRKVEEPSELAEALGAPVLGRLPAPGDPAAPLDALDEDTSAALRSLRVGLAAAGAGSAFVVAGIDEADDDGWLATATAVGLASVHDRVLLVQADPGAVGPPVLRAVSTPRPAKGGTGTSGGAVSPAPADATPPGLAEGLRGRPLAELARPGRVPGLSVLTPGQDLEALPALLETGFAALLKSATADYDVVVVQAPPLARNDDARLMGTDGRVLLWTRLGRASTRQTLELARGLRTVRADVLGGVVVERPSRWRRGLRR